MRWFINYIRTCFCVHYFEFEEKNVHQMNQFGRDVCCGEKVSATCKICGYHKSYWKFK
jgi:hypothetical protein